MSTVPPQTPKSKPPSNSSPQTPQSRTSSQTIESAPRSQDDLKNLLYTELHGHVFESKSLIQTVFPVPTQVEIQVGKAVDDFVSNFLSNKTDGIQELTKKDKPERSYYDPFCSLLNAAASIAPQDSSSPGHISKLKFTTYDKPVADKSDGKGELKPDFVGCVHGASDANQERLYFHDISVAGGVKGNWAEALKQASTYGRSMLELGSRWYSLVIVYNHIQRKIRFCFFTRMGLFLTPALHILDKADLKSFVKGMIGLVICDEARAGFSTFQRSLDEYVLYNLPTSLPRGEWWKVDKILWRRVCILGRATHVYLLILALALIMNMDTLTNEFKKVTVSSGIDVNYTTHMQTRSKAKEATPNSHILHTSIGHLNSPEEHLAHATHPSQSRRSRRLVELDKISNTQTSSSPSTSQVSSDAAVQLPPSLAIELRKSIEALSSPDWTLAVTWTEARGKPIVLKDSWPLRSRASAEMKMFEAVQGQHGIPDILGGFTVPHPTDIFSDLEDVQICDDYYGKQKRPTCDPIVEPRVQNYLIALTEGESLVGAEPYDIGHAAVDGIIGHFNLFLNGHLHRDVSSGNVLRMPKVVQRSRDYIQKMNACFSHPKVQNTGEFIFLLEYMSECLGFINDGDQAIEWRKDRESGRHRSGTLPFMSQRITRGWILDEFILHTAIDDLESFAWLVLWCALYGLENPSNLEALWIERLTADDLHQVLDRKTGIITDLSKESTRLTMPFSKPLVQLLPLASDWLSLSQEAAERLDMFLLTFVANSQYETLEDVIADFVLAKEFYDQLEDLSIDFYTKYLWTGVKFLQSRKEEPTIKSAT
ncbi:hypothetical protein DFH11DRAFT_1754236 [Phellopilus nigrolimitatus]|nr:hypothetical protein DFH11DRAFT_1754236 [Phellopilus nigrolimitatus]